MDPETPQPIGAAVANWSPRALPGPVTMTGAYSALAPLTIEHAPQLLNHWLASGHDRDWTYFPYSCPTNLQAAEDLITYLNTQGHAYAVIDKVDSTALGIATIIRVDQANGTLEIAHLNFTDAMKRSRIATEAIYLMLSYAFDMLAYRRCEWKCDSLNQPSRAAALRFGFTFEGEFRQAVVYKNRNRDTSWYAIIDRDWPRIRAGYQRWLAAENFASAGLQRTRLQDCYPPCSENLTR